MELSVVWYGYFLESPNESFPCGFTFPLGIVQNSDCQDVTL